LGQLANADEIVWIETANPVDQIVANLGPSKAGRSVTLVMPHGGRPGREDGDVGAAFPLEFELRFFQALADLVIADGQACR